MPEGRAPPVPFDLMRLPIYRKSNEWTRIRLARAWGTSGWMRWCGKFNARIFSFVFEPTRRREVFENQWANSLAPLVLRRVTCKPNFTAHVADVASPLDPSCRAVLSCFFAAMRPAGVLAGVSRCTAMPRRGLLA